MKLAITQFREKCREYEQSFLSLLCEILACTVLIFTKLTTAQRLHVYTYKILPKSITELIFTKIASA
jgi:hypothetical protein